MTEHSSDWVRAALAFLIVVASILLIGLAWGLRDIEEAERIAVVFSGILGAVVGFYFGRQGVEDAQRLTRETIEQKDAVASAHQQLLGAIKRDEKLREQLGMFL